METRLQLGKRAISVALDEDADGHRAVVDGASHRVRPIVARAARSADGGEASELVVAIDGRVRRAVVVRAGDRLLVSLDGRPHAFGLGEAPRRGAAGAGVGIAVAPMPGKVLRVLVAVGDAVESGQPLVVLEAMKMETTLRAEIAGTVAVVGAIEGAMVDGGAVLVEIAPTPG